MKKLTLTIMFSANTCRQKSATFCVENFAQSGSNERTPTQSVRGIVRSAKELHSGLIPFISPQREMFPTETGIKPSARIKC